MWATPHLRVGQGSSESPVTMLVAMWPHQHQVTERGFKVSQTSRGKVV